MTNNEHVTAVVGSTGFVGSAVARGLPTRTIRRISRTPPIGHPGSVAADLTNLTSLRNALRGTQSVIHCAPHVGPSEDQNFEINERGTANLLQAAREHGIRHVTYVSTTGVYGPGPHRGGSELTPTNPSSVTSASRLVAEDLVVAFGGSVIRPHLLYGPGDSHVIPMLIRALDVMGGLPNDGANMISILDVRHFARQIIRIHLAALRGRLKGTRLNACSGAPVTIRRVREELELKLMRKIPADAVPILTASRLLTKAGFTAHQAVMITEDDWYISSYDMLADHSLISRSDDSFALDDECVHWYMKTLELQTG